MNGKMTILACITGFLLDCIFGEVVVQSDSCVRTREEKQKRSSGRWNFMDFDSFIIISCTDGALICCREGSSGSTVSFGNLLVLPDICGAVSCRRK